MSDPEPEDRPQASSTGNQLYDEAADWFALLRGPDADAHRDAFSAWLARGALHRAAYNRMAEIFSLGKNLENPSPAGDDVKPSARPWYKKAPTLAAAFICLMVIAWVAYGRGADNPLAHPSRQTAQIEQPVGVQIGTRIGSVRSFTLADGSHVILDTDSLVTVDFDNLVRRVRLVRGRARFNVAHATRPFIVSAGSGTVVARGTVFDVALSLQNCVAVTLIRGAVDVLVDRHSDDMRDRADQQRLQPGQQTHYAQYFTDRIPTKAASLSDWTASTRVIMDEKLADIAAEANRYSVTQIILDDPTLEGVHISGRFQLNNADMLATRLASLLSLSIERKPGQILLKPKSLDIQRKK